MAKETKSLAEQIAKLPKWAQEHITSITRSYEVVQRELKDYVDSSTPSEFSITEYVDGKFVKRYIQTHSIDVIAHGVKVTVRVGYDRDKVIKVEWGSPDRSMQHVAFVPTSLMQAEIMSKENMR